MLVTHDRYMLDRVSTIVLGLDGTGGAERFADYSQWDAWQRKQASAGRKAQNARAPPPASPQRQRSQTDPTKFKCSGPMPPAETATRRKLSYQESREFANMEEIIAQAEAHLAAKRDELADPQLASDGPRLLATCAAMEEAQRNVDQLYARWAELAAKKE